MKIRSIALSTKKFLAAGLAAALLAGALPVVAGAQVTSPTCEQYSPSTGNFGGGGGSSTNCQHSSGGGGGLSSPIGSLPFTGFDVISMAAVALAVTGIGLILQRAVAKPREDL